MAAIVLGLSAPAAVLAQQPASSEVQLLLKRLEEAEARLRVLENERGSQAGQTGVTSPATYGKVPPPPAPPSVGGSVHLFETDGLPRPHHSAVWQDGTNGPQGNGSVASPSPGDADDQSFARMLQEMQERWKKQEELNEQFSEQVEARVGRVTSNSTLAIGGRIHSDYWAFPGDSPGTNALETGDAFVTPQDRFLFRRIRIHAEGTINDNMLYKAETEFAEGNDFEVRDLYIGFDDLPWFQRVLVGNQKRPYGLDHLNSSRYNIFIERPFVVESFNEDTRRLGIVSYGVSEDQDWNWRYGVYNMRRIQDEGKYISDHYQLELAGRLANTFYYDEANDGRNYAHWAISGTIAHPDGSAGGDPMPPFAPGDNRRAANEARFHHRPEARSSNRWIDTGRIAGADWYQLMGLESVVNVGPLQVVGEYMNVWLQRDPMFGDDDLFFHGAYAYASYFLTGEHMEWDRKSGTLARIQPFENFFLLERCCGKSGGGWGAWQVAVRYSYADLSDDNILGGLGENVTLGLVWYLNPNANIQFNYIHGSISERNITDLNGLTFAGGDYDIIGGRLRIDF